MRGVIGVVAVVLWLAAFGGSASAADFTVDSLADPPADALPGNGCEATDGDECTLREAVLASNALGPTGTDRILFAPSLNGGTIVRTQENEMLIRGSVEVVGPGRDLLTLSGDDTDDATHEPILALRAFDEVGQLRTFSGLTFRGGAPAIDSQTSGEKVAIRDSRFTENSATDGGAIYNLASEMLVERSMFDDNETTTGYGGAIANGERDTTNRSLLTVRDSTFTSNQNTSGGAGGAVYSNAGRVVIERSTFHGNTGNVDGGGGAILAENPSGAVDSSLSIADSTITENLVLGPEPGGGVAVDGPVDAAVTDSIVALNHNTGPDPDDLAGSFDAVTNSLLTSTAGATFPPPPAPPVGLNVVGQDPQLGPLQDNGGPTLTRAPLTSTSPAVDNAASAAAVDQRGYVRPFDVPAELNAPGGNGSDIGAVEFGSAPPVTEPPPGGGPGDPPSGTTPAKKCKKKKKKKGKKKRCKKKRKKK
jgi:hypothetical protein